MPSKAHLILRGAEHESFALRRRVSKDTQWSCKAVVPSLGAFRLAREFAPLTLVPSSVIRRLDRRICLHPHCDSLQKPFGGRPIRRSSRRITPQGSSEAP